MNTVVFALLMLGPFLAFAATIVVKRWRARREKRRLSLQAIDQQIKQWRFTSTIHDAYQRREMSQSESPPIKPAFESDDKVWTIRRVQFQPTLGLTDRQLARSCQLATADGQAWQTWLTGKIEEWLADELAEPDPIEDFVERRTVLLDEEQRERVADALGLPPKTLSASLFLNWRYHSFYYIVEMAMSTKATDQLVKGCEELASVTKPQEDPS